MFEEAMGAPVAVDLFCCEGGMSAGLRSAGFLVYGVDITYQPRYPFPFYQADALSFISYKASELRARCSLITASPPCQLYSKTHRINRSIYPDLIGPVRAALESLGIPYVIENVEDARTELRNPVTLCGAMFGIETYRHRLFETGNGLTLSQPMHPPHRARNAKMGRKAEPGEFMHIVGNFPGVDRARHIMGMPWASRNGLCEAVPVPYGMWIGNQAMSQIHGMEGK